MPHFLCWMWPNYRGCWDGRLKMPRPWIHSDCRLHSCTSELSRISKSFLRFAKAKGNNAALISALWSSDIQTHLSVLFFKLFFFFLAAWEISRSSNLPPADPRSSTITLCKAPCNYMHISYSSEGRKKMTASMSGPLEPRFYCKQPDRFSLLLDTMKGQKKGMFVVLK